MRAYVSECVYVRATCVCVCPTVCVCVCATVCLRVCVCVPNEANVAVKLVSC